MADTWTAISGYTPQDYTDTAVFEVDSETKKIALITGQALVAGEENSQYIKFVLDRYWDGIDIKDKAFYVEYALAGQYYGKTSAVNAEYNTEQIRFGWVVPKEACCISGTLLFILRIESEDYVLKTQIAEHPVFKSVNVEGVVPEPTKEAWYREFEARVESAISEAENAISAAQAVQMAAEIAAQNAKTAEDNAEAAAQLAQTASQDAQSARGAVETASQTAQTAAQTAQVSQEAAENAKDDALAAQTAAETAEQNAQTYANNAEGARDDAIAAQGAAETAQQFAETAQTGAVNSKNAAQTAQNRAEQALADTRAAIAADSATTALNITRVISTTYMTDAQLERVSAWKKHRMLFLKFNAEFTNTGFSATTFQTIATIGGWSALSEVIVSIPNQTDGTKVLTLFVKSNGEVQVYSPSAISGFYRGYVCVPYSG